VGLIGIICPKYVQFQVSQKEARIEQMRNVGIYLFNKVELLDFAGPYEVFSTAAELNDRKQFRVFTISEDGGAIKSVNGLIVIPDYSFSNHPKIDILIIPGGEGTKAEIKKKKVMEWVDRTQGSAEIMATVCSGARIPAVLGLLDGLEATTHQSVIDDVKKLAPNVTIDHSKTIYRQREDHDVRRDLSRDRPLAPHSEKTLRRNTPKKQWNTWNMERQRPKTISLAIVKHISKTN
jgi:putative intracellular protease/amidase